MKNLTLINRIYFTKLFLYFLLQFGLMVTFNNLLYSQGNEYSRKFIHSTQGGDILRFPPQNTTDIFYTSFKWETLDELLKGSHDSWYVKITLVNPIFKTPRFRLTLFDSEGEVRGRNGDFPCPEECVPPLDSIRNLPDNTFAVADLKSTMNRAGATFVNVHTSFRNFNGEMITTHSIYAVSGTINNLNNIVIHTQTTDPMFTSVKRIE